MIQTFKAKIYFSNENNWLCIHTVLSLCNLKCTCSITAGELMYEHGLLSGYTQLGTNVALYTRAPAILNATIRGGLRGVLEVQTPPYFS